MALLGDRTVRSVSRISYRLYEPSRQLRFKRKCPEPYVREEVVGHFSLLVYRLILSPAECAEYALMRARGISIVGESRLILVRSRENRQQFGKR
jgi:hypothetical protein